ncbi:MAG: hypothetical protein QM564_07475 [Bergeyella sp.]
MKNIVFIFILTIIYSCSTLESFNYNQSKNPWENAFKDHVFFKCIKESYKNDSIIFRKLTTPDLFNPYDGISIEEIKLAEKIGKEIITKIPPPKMCEECNKGENYYMANCLHYYKSKNLDSIAKKLYKEKMKQDKKIWGKDYK